MIWVNTGFLVVKSSNLATCVPAKVPADSVFTGRDNSREWIMKADDNFGGGLSPDVKKTRF